MMLHPKIAKHHLAVNLWWILQNRNDNAGYSWLADALTERTGQKVYPSRIQKILQQDTSPDWVFAVNLADILDVNVESLGKTPSKTAEKCYSDRFPRIAESA